MIIYIFCDYIKIIPITVFSFCYHHVEGVDIVMEVVMWKFPPPFF